MKVWWCKCVIMVTRPVGHFPGTQLWPRHCWFATTPLWEWLLSHWDVTGLLKAIFVCNPLGWTEMSCESHLNMHFICQPEGSRWSLVGMSSQHSCRAAPMEMPLESQPCALFFLRRRQHKEHCSAELEAAENSLTAFTWKADKDISTDSLSSISFLPPLLGFHSSHGYFMWIFLLPVRALDFVSAFPVIPHLWWTNQKAILCPRDQPCQTSSFHQQDWVPSVLGWTLQSLWRALKPDDSLEQTKFQDLLNSLGSESRVGCGIWGVSVAH